MTLPETLFDFAFCHVSNYDILADLAAQEDWGCDNSVLKNYVMHLYRRIVQVHDELDAAGEPDPHLYLTDDVACFDTGLYTERYENI